MGHAASGGAGRGSVVSLRRGLRAALGLVALIALALPCPPHRAKAQEVGDKEQDAPRPDREGRGAAQDEAPAEVPYRVAITGVEDPGLAGLLEASSQLFALQDRPPPTLSRLRLRAEEDLERLGTALRSEGYYEATLAYRLDQEAVPVGVTLEVAPGPRYRLADFRIDYVGQAAPDPADRPDLEALRIQPDMPARAPEIVAAQDRWQRLMTERGYPLARVEDRRAVIDREAGSMTVTLRVDPGPMARFGTVRFSGLDGVEEDHVRRLLPWREGELYDSRKLEAARGELVGSGLFSSVTVKPAAALEDGDTIPIEVDLVEAPHRSIGFGASFSTDVGFGGEVFWEHRNLFDRGEQLRLAVTAAQIEQSVAARFRKPEFLSPDQTLLASAAFDNKNTDAFDERSVSAYGGIELPVAENWLVTGGFAPEYTQLEDDLDKREFLLFGLPLTAARDATDDLLNPTRGTRLDLSLTPYYGTGDDDVAFVRSTVGGSAYVAVDPDDRFVLAGRARVGSLFGESTETVPANKRFFAGGGGSIRGFEFQSVGPLRDNDPLGGRSLVEVSAELRVRVFDSFGVVPFVDGGTVFDSSYPSFDETLRWAAGLGFRYFTGFGPIRVDFAFPLNRRDVDDFFQFYVSFGQAF